MDNYNDHGAADAALRAEAAALRAELIAAQDLAMGQQDHLLELERTAAALRAELAATRELLSSALGNSDTFHDQAVDRLLTLKEMEAELAEAASIMDHLMHMCRCCYGERCSHCDAVAAANAFIAKHKPEPCGTCNDTRWINRKPPFDRARMPCPDCTSGIDTENPDG